MAKILTLRRSKIEIDRGALYEALTSWLNSRPMTTRRQYLRIAREWSEHLGCNIETKSAIGLWSRARHAQAQSFVNAQTKRPAQPGRAAQASHDGQVSLATVRHKVVILKAIYQELIAQGALELNPFARLALELKKHNSSQRRPHSRVSGESVKALLQLERPRLAGVTEAKEWVRDVAIMHLFFGAALRRSEVIGLRVGDVMTSPEGTSYLRLARTKSQKVQTVSLPDWVASKVLALVDQRLEDGASQDDALCVIYFKGKQQAFSDSTIYRLFKRHCKALGLENVSPHCARVTAITQLLDQGLSHRDVQELSRHSSVVMVERYDRKRVEIDNSASKKLKY